MVVKGLPVTRNGLLLCWYFIIVSLATEADRKTKVQNKFYCSTAFGHAGTTANKQNKS